MAKKGVLLINIGSPDSYEVKDVQSYLKKFLMDKWIIDLPYPLRWLLVYGLIVPKRSPFSAANYRKVWMPEGSPLIVYSNRFKKKLQEELGPEYKVLTGMCFSNPSIEDSLKILQQQNLENILAVPLFPQYAGATTGSVIDTLQKVQKKLHLKTPLRILQPFYNQPGLIRNSARIAQESLHQKKIDHYVFSFHGLPEKQVRKQGCALDDSCTQSDKNCVPNCYRSQCYENARLVAQEMKLDKSQWTVAFQSRLGRAKWLTPSTDDTLQSLAQRSIKNLAVLCPSFVADCIETLEEIGIGAAEDFKHHGGENLHLVPCLNDDGEWVKSFAEICRQN